MAISLCAHSESQNLLKARESHYVAVRATVIGLCNLIILCVTLAISEPQFLL